MPSYPIGERPMTSGERSARNLLQQRQEIADIRTTLVESIELLLKQGHMLMADGHRKEAFDAFRMAEMQNNHILKINDRLKYHESKIVSVRLAPRKGFPIPLDPRKDLSLTVDAESDAQRAYRLQRANLRPEIEARYGHLAKAEKATESVE